MPREIHPSHEMTEWDHNAIVTIIETPRFGSIRECKHCGAEHAKTVAGEGHHDELFVRCYDNPNYVEP